MLGYEIKQMFMGSNKHTLLEDYMEEISMLSEMAEEVDFTIITEAIIWHTRIAKVFEGLI